MGWLYNATPELEAESSWENIFIAGVILTPLMTLVVSLRIWSRWKMLAAEDFVVVFSAICSIIYVALSIMQTRYGLGLVPAKRPPGDFYMYTMYNYAGRPFYLTGIGCFKVALCLSYLRFTARTTTGQFRRIVFLVIAFVVSTTITFIVLNIFGCTPISKIFDRRIPGKCLPFAPVNFYISAAIVLSDLVIFLLPIRMIRFLSLPPKKKMQICVMFGLGLFTTVFSVLRAAAIPNIAYGNGDSTNLVLYSDIELNVGIITSCLPYLRKLFDRKKQTPYHSDPNSWSAGYNSRDKQIKRQTDIELRDLDDRHDSEDSILRPEERPTGQPFTGSGRPKTPRDILQTRCYQVSHSDHPTDRTGQ
ncbi:hypothetical protein BDZ85DRAFT_11772 [Elsinoe ampelina]|uniref:Rhodopsin domain-containing protein n=1 Tax=Elsinoe ampelina TaxID=302913 RepID=A0A6A6GR65_9PEZI|nr:hypothetical protein BDZ85DRAFT_11772 [Elsinoe ampelina]